MSEFYGFIWAEGLKSICVMFILLPPFGFFFVLIKFEFVLLLGFLSLISLVKYIGIALGCTLRAFDLEPATHRVGVVGVFVVTVDLYLMVSFTMALVLL